MTMDERKRLEVLAEQAKAVERIRDACETFERGGMSYRHVVDLIEDVIDGQTRIVRVGETQKPEVQS
jgi:hypothetical protein